jgi:hypothetical protein
VHHVAHALADAWLSGPWTLEGMRRRTRELGGRRQLSASLESMILGFWLELRDHAHQRRRAPLAAAIEAHAAFRYMSRMNVESPVLEPAVMAASPGDWKLPDLPTPGRLARWLEVDPAELVWLADHRAIAGHYRRYWCGSRLIEAPRRRLKAAQRRITKALLGQIPAHDAAHGFRRGRSVLSAVRPHAAREVLVVADLRAFFPSIRAARVHATFQQAGYPEAVARRLTQLCTTTCRALPDSADRAAPGSAARYGARHLPQGAPTSPALANLGAFRLDARLTGLADAAGAAYTRYADDMIFSGPSALGRQSFLGLVERIATEEGFELNPAKSRVMRQSQRQQVLGIVLNDAPTLARRELEQLEAALFNCLGRGSPRGGQRGIDQLRDHLRGRVAWARHINEHRARRVVELLAAIDQAQPTNAATRGGANPRRPLLPDDRDG